MEEHSVHPWNQGGKFSIRKDTGKGNFLQILDVSFEVNGLHFFFYPSRLPRAPPFQRPRYMKREKSEAKKFLIKKFYSLSSNDTHSSDGNRNEFAVIFLMEFFHHKRIRKHKRLFSSPLFSP